MNEHYTNDVQVQEYYSALSAKHPRSLTYASIDLLVKMPPRWAIVSCSRDKKLSMHTKSIIRCQFPKGFIHECLLVQVPISIPTETISPLNGSLFESSQGGRKFKLEILPVNERPLLNPSHRRYDPKIGNPSGPRQGRKEILETSWP